MNATVRTIVWGVYPAGSLVGGILGSRFGLIQAILLGSLSFLAAAWLLVRPLIAMKENPGQPEPQPI